MTTDTDAPTVEAEMWAWQEQRWPNVDLRVVAAKLAEECGEVCGAINKWADNRAGGNDIAAELGDLLIVASTIAARLDTTLDELRARRWVTVRAR